MEPRSSNASLVPLYHIINSRGADPVSLVAQGPVPNGRCILRPRKTSNNRLDRLLLLMKAIVLRTPGSYCATLPGVRRTS